MWWPLRNIHLTPLERNLLEITKNWHFSMRGKRSVFCQHHSSRTSYHTRNDWLQYQINLVTRVPVDFQQKQYRSQWSVWPSNYSCVQCLHPVWKMATLLCLCLIFCAGKIFEHGNPILSNKYKNDYMNHIIIVIITTNNTYLSKWCTTITKYYPVTV